MTKTSMRLLFRYANLLAAARATLSAEQDGEADPMWYLRDELRATGHLPADLDDATTAHRGTR
jgi:hypothetical protein